MKTYSTDVGHNMLAKVIKHLGIEVLYHFGINQARISRMLTKGLTGGEIDLLFSIWAARGNFEVKYIKQWEYELLITIFRRFNTYFYIKPVLMLSLFTGLNGTHINYLKKGEPYEKMIFNNQSRKVLDRVLLYDALIYYIIELDKFLSIDKLTTISLLSKDLSTEEPNSSKVFFTWFSYIKADSQAYYRTPLTKDKVDIKKLEKIIKDIKSVYKTNGIINIQEYCKQMTPPYRKKKWNHTFNNFSAHGRMPNIFLQNLRTSFRTLYNEHKQKLNKS